MPTTDPGAEPFRRFLQVRGEDGAVELLSAAKDMLIKLAERIAPGRTCDLLRGLDLTAGRIAVASQMPAIMEAMTTVPIVDHTTVGMHFYMALETWRSAPSDMLEALVTHFNACAKASRSMNNALQKVLR